MRIRGLLAIVAAFIWTGPAVAASSETARAAPKETPSSPDGADPLLDAIAADFFEDHLRLSQSRRIEAATASQYLSLSAEEKSDFRATRREIWRRMTDEEKALLRGVKQPRYSNLTEQQKQAFRRIAAQEIGVLPVPALSVSMRDDI